jgi:hypothetical protein
VGNLLAVTDLSFDVFPCTVETESMRRAFVHAVSRVVDMKLNHATAAAISREQEILTIQQAREGLEAGQIPQSWRLHCYRGDLRL